MSRIRPRRSVLYMPASNARALEKAKNLSADCLILDLEDAVSPDSKETARAQAVKAVTSGAYGGKELTIRINAADTEWHQADLVAAAEAGPDAIVVPKVDSATAVTALIDAMKAAGVPDRTKLWAMIESPRAILDADKIAAASDRLTVLVLGTNDLVKEMYAEHVPGRAPILAALTIAVLAARANGKVILDGVFNDVRNIDGFIAECEQGRQLGLDGKTLIHPGQIDGANRSFAPSEDAIADASGLIDCWEAATQSGEHGVVTYQGRMVENLHVEQARRTLAIAEMVRNLS